MILRFVNTQHIIDVLRQKGYKVTTQRLAVWEFVLTSKDHPTAEQVYEKVKRKHPTVSLATIYQALHVMTKVGLVHEMGFSDRISRYDPNTAPHINIICEKCGEIRDYDAEEVKQVWSRLIDNLDFKPSGQRLDVYWTCGKCREPK